MKNLNSLFPLVLLFVISLAAKAQTPDSLANKTKPNTLIISGYIDAYYVYDFNKPQDHERPSFFFNHRRHNEFNVNIALLRLAYTSEKIRGNIGLMAGTYSQYNLAAEQDLLKNIYEANAGFKVMKKVWLDAGIFPSHIGVETVITRDNLNLTRSIGADNSPYYETGAKLTFEATNKLTLTGLVLNGWQNIREIDGNSNKAFGTQIQYKLSDKILLNYSTFIGNEKPDSAKQMRYFNDLYATISAMDKLSLVAVFDFGIEEKPAGLSGTYKWWTPTLSVKYQFTNKVAAAARGEYYHDKNGIIIACNTPNGFQTLGYSLNLDYAPSEQVLLRFEGRMLDSKDKVFTNEKNKPTDKNTFVATSLSFKF